MLKRIERVNSTGDVQAGTTAPVTPVSRASVGPVRPRIVLALPALYRVLRGNHALAFLVTSQALSSLPDWLLALALAVLDRCDRCKLMVGVSVGWRTA